MKDEILINEYRSLHTEEKSVWKQFTGINEFIWDGVYAIRLAKEDKLLELPFEFAGKESINLVVNDQAYNSSTQDERIIVQTLTRVERLSGHVQTYTRTCRYSNGSLQWREWVKAGGANEATIIRQTESTASIQPNVLNIWDEVQELDITLLPPTDNNIVNEYMVQFTSGDVATTLILPDSIKWASVPVIQPNKIYQLSIVNNLAVMGEFSDE